MYETSLICTKVYTIFMETSKDISDKNARVILSGHGKAIGLLDLDAFFASVEQL